ncbi:MAG: hypothetical protein AAGL24_07145 [Pseudomonadota bacterium]
MRALRSHRPDKGHGVPRTKAAGGAFRLLGVVAGLFLILVASEIRAEPLAAGGFSFSDELGGFTIGRVTGRGTQDDPIVIEKNLTDVEPVIMVIRYDKSSAVGRVGTGRWIAVHLRLVVRNGSGRVWQGFQVELQEILHKPSIRQDGLSFDQGKLVSANVYSNRFSASQRLFEPYDRILFQDGHVNPADFVDFTMHITDPTPVKKFYLLLDPQILYSKLLKPAPAERTFG